MADARPVSGGASAGRSVWVVTAGMAAVAGLLFGLTVTRLHAPPHHLSFFAVVALFAAAHTAVLNLDAGSWRGPFSLVEVPLVLGLLTLDPKLVVAAWLLGGALSLALVHRQAPTQLAFNLSAFGLQAVLAVLVFHAITNARHLVSGSTFLGAVTASLVASVVGAVAVWGAVTLTEEARPRAEGMREIGWSVATSLVTACATLVGVVLEQADPPALLLLVAPIGGVVAGYRLARRTASRGSGSEPEESRDPLTGLPDRSSLAGHLARMGSDGDGSGRNAALLLVVLDEVDTVRDRLGPETGDQLLVVAAQRVVGCLREGDVAVRMGSSDLAVVARVEADAAENQASVLGGRIVAAVNRPASIGDLTLPAGGRVAVVPWRPGQVADDVLAQAEGAVAAARAAPEGSVEVFVRRYGGGARRWPAGTRNRRSPTPNRGAAASRRP